MTTENQASTRLGFRVAAIAAVALATAAVVLAPIIPGASATPRAQATATDDAGSVGVRLVDVPETLLDDPRARQYIIDELVPGTTIERRIEITNTTDEIATVQAYAAAASIVDGAFVGADARTANDLSSWTSLGEPEVAVPANSSVLNTVTVEIPADAPPGEQYAAVWVEAAATGDGDVQVVNRVGVRMYVSVGGDNAAASSFVIESMTASRDADGNGVVTAELKNTGGRALDATADLTLAATSGSLTAGPYPATLGTTIAPGSTESLTVVITDDIGEGPWTATLEVTSGLLAETFDAELAFPGQGTADAVAASDTSSIPVWLAVVLAFSALLVVAGGAFAALTLHRRRAIALREKADETPIDAD